MLINRGVAFRNLGAFDLSLSDLTEAVNLDGEDLTAIKMKAWTLREMGRQLEALPLYDLAIARSPDAQALLSRCVVNIDLERYSKAFPDCERALTLERSADALYFTALLLDEEGRGEEAVAYAEETLSHDSALPQHFALVAELQKRLGRMPEARATVRAGIERFPDNADLVALSKDLLQ